MKSLLLKFKLIAEDRASRVVDGIKDSLKSFKGQLVALAAGVVSIAAIVTALTAVRDVTIQIADAGAELQRLTVRLGVNAEVLSQYRFLAKATGVEFDSLIDSMQNMRVRASEAAQGEKEMLEPFEKLGIKIKEFKKLNIVEQFEALAIAFERVKDSGEALMLADQIFEGEGLAMLQTLRKGISEVERLRKEGDRLGASLTTRQTEQLAQIQEMIGKMSTAWEGFKTAFVLNIAPTVIRALEWMTEWLTGSMGNMQLWFHVVESGWIKARIMYHEAQKWREELLNKDVIHKALKGDKRVRELDRAIAKLHERLAEIGKESQGWALDKTFGTKSFISDINKLMKAITKAGVKSKETVFTFTAVFKTASEAASSAAQEMYGHFADFLFDPLETSIGDLAKNFLNTIRRMMTDHIAQQLWMLFFPVRAGHASQSIDMGLDKLLNIATFLPKSGALTGVGRPITLNVSNTTNVTGGGRLDPETKAYIDQSNQRMKRETVSAVERTMNAGQLNPRKGYGY